MVGGALLFFSLLLTCPAVIAQRYVSFSSHITFFSDAPVEDIRAVNDHATGIFDANSREVAFSVPVKDFQFEKSLMRDHFNEKYLETEKYPKATFQGIVEGFNGSIQGSHQVVAKGQMQIHGVTKEMDIPGTITQTQGTMQWSATFHLKLVDFKIKIPRILWQNIAEQVEVQVDFQMKPR